MERIFSSRPKQGILQVLQGRSSSASARLLPKDLQAETHGATLQVMLQAFLPLLLNRVDEDEVRRQRGT